MTRDEKRFLKCLEAKQKSGELQWNRLSAPNVSHMILTYLGTEMSGYKVILEKQESFFCGSAHVSLRVNDESGKQAFELLDYGTMWQETLESFFIPTPRRLLRFFNTVSKSVVRHELAEQDRNVAEATHQICTEDG